MNYVGATSGDRGDGRAAATVTRTYLGSEGRAPSPENVVAAGGEVGSAACVSYVCAGSDGPAVFVTVRGRGGLAPRDASGDGRAGEDELERKE
jgi:hypothetical protein